MAVKLALVFLAVFFLVQFVASSSIRHVRDAPTAADTGKAIDDAVENLKSGFDDLLKNLQDNDMLKDLQETVQKLGDTIQTQGKDLVDKIQANAKPSD